MKIDYRKLLPHAVAIILFLVSSTLYTKPAFSDKVVAQHDVQQWKAMAQQSFEFKEKHGHFPRWTNSMFSGMPAYLIAMENRKDIGVHVFHFHDFLKLGLPKPTYYLFFACLGFYFLCIAMRVNPWLSIVGGLAYGYCSYNPILITAGHDTKLLSMCYSPAVLASLILIFRKQYYIGTAALLVMLTCMIGQGHQQIVYYTLIMALCLVVAFIIRTVKSNDFKHLFLSGGISLGIAILSVLACANGLFPTYEYSKETMRGGHSKLTQTDKKNETKGGLDKDYAFNWSYGKAESFTLLMPNAFGGGSSTSFGDNPKIVEVLQNNPNIPQQMAEQILQASRPYWGPQPPPVEPVYMGAFICVLFLCGAILLKNPDKWWIIAITVISLVLAWGKNLQGINYFLFDYLPFYNKFRAPSMALVMAQLSIPLLGVLFLQNFMFDTPKEKLKTLFKHTLYVAGGVAALMLGFYFTADFSNESTAELRKSISEAMQGTGGDFVRSYFSALSDDRAALVRADLIRSLGFIVAGIGILFLHVRKIASPLVVSIALILLTAIDLMSVGRRFVNDEKFVEAEDYDTAYAMTNADMEIKKLPGFFRVMNLAFKDPSTGEYYADISSSFNDAIASYKHNTIGGYHPAKLSIYQDLISMQIGKNVQAWAANQTMKDSFPVLNMLNMRFVILPDQQNPTQTVAVANPHAMGNAWLVNRVAFVKNADEEMASLNNFDPKQVAFVDQEFKNKIPFQPVADTAATIALVENKNDEITYNFNSATNQFAVFSEIYYAAGWNAYVDGKAVDHVRTNYVLRGMAVPAGNHTIQFKFEPKLVELGDTITMWAGIISVLIVIGCLYMHWRTRRKDPVPVKVTAKPASK
jgi:hypothetical protein